MVSKSTLIMPNSNLTNLRAKMNIFAIEPVYRKVTYRYSNKDDTDINKTNSHCYKTIHIYIVIPGLYFRRKKTATNYNTSTNIKRASITIKLYIFTLLLEWYTCSIVKQEWIVANNDTRINCKTGVVYTQTMIRR